MEDRSSWNGWCEIESEPVGALADKHSSRIESNVGNLQRHAEAIWCKGRKGSRSGIIGRGVNRIIIVGF